MEYNYLGFDIALLVLALLGLIISALAVKGFLVEFRQGLAISKKRLIVTASCGMILLLLAIGGIFFVGNETKKTEEKTEALTEDKKKLPPKINKDSLNKELKLAQGSLKEIVQKLAPFKPLNQKKTDLEVRIDNINKQLNPALSNKPKPPEPPTLSNFIPGLNRKFLCLGFALFFFLLSLCTLFLVGDFRSIFSKKWFNLFNKKEEKISKKEQVASQKLEEMAAAIQKETYEGALQIAQEIDTTKLERLDEIDFFYLKNYCQVQILLANSYTKKEAPTPLTSERRRELIEATENSLIHLLEEAPRMEEAKYLLAIVYTLNEKYDLALPLFQEAEKKINIKEVDFKFMKSYCLLHLAKEKLNQADSAGADEFFKQVLDIGVMEDRVPSVLIKNRLNKVMTAYRERDFVTARENLRAIQTQQLSEERQETVTTISEAIEILLLHTENKVRDTFNQTETFLTQRLPAILPIPDDQAADEYIFKSFEEDDLPISSQLFRAFFFLQAFSLLQLKIREYNTLSAKESEDIGYYLLRALQFDLRNREVLGALGVLYFWFNPSKREKALNWMEISTNLGTENQYLLELVERYHNVEVNRQRLLAQFKDLSIKYFTNSTVSKQLKEELLLELGQFQEFKPVLMELDEISQEEAKSPTVATLLSRSQYLNVLTAEITKNKPFFKDIKKVQSFYMEYGQLVANLEGMANKIEEIEQDIMKEIGRVVLL